MVGTVKIFNTLYVNIAVSDVSDNMYRESGIFRNHSISANADMLHKFFPIIFKNSSSSNRNPSKLRTELNATYDCSPDAKTVNPELTTA
jgi:hypothetical protein